MTNNLVHLLFLSITILFFIAANGRKITPHRHLANEYPWAARHRNFSHVCDAKRFANLGLDMGNFAYCDKSLPYEIRVKALIDKMTLSEKVQQLGHNADGVDRLGLPKYNWWSEALHGVSDTHVTFFDDNVPGATSFPTVIVSAASFNESLWKTIGQVVSTEARAMYNEGQAGLTFWSPNINPVRDPRWGRTLESPGEDPFVIGRYAVNYVRGLQDVDGTENTKDLNSRPLKVASCCKHYAAYDLESWSGNSRYLFDARVTEQDMRETFLKPFEMCVKDGDVASVMCSFNRVNGIPSCADPQLLKNTMRRDWGLHGYIVSDCDSVRVMVENQKWLSDKPEDGVSQALKAGLDLDCGEYYTNHTQNAVIQGKVGVPEIDKALKNLYVVLMRVGFFDGSLPQFKDLGKDDVCSEAHIELATDAARQGIVLLKNENETLPLSSKFKTIALIGHHANATYAMTGGNYAGVPCRYTSPLDGFSSSQVKVIYEMGCDDIDCPNDNHISQAAEAAKKADATVIMVGLDTRFVESENLDREDLLLPGYQIEMIQQVSKASKGPTILVIMSGGGVDISLAKVNDDIGAILWAGYPGEEGGQAIADIVFGRYNPGGRLPLTWYESSYVKTFPMTSMQLRPVDRLGYPGRTYKFFNGSTVYPFGYGLSYTKFTYKLVSSHRTLVIKQNKFQHCRDLKYNDDVYKPPCPALLTDDIECKDDFKFVVQVDNVGRVGGSEVVLVYRVPPRGIARAPIKELVGFKRVFVEAGKSEKVSFELNACKSLGIVDDKAYHLLPNGEHTILIGDGAVSFPVKVHFKH